MAGEEAAAPVPEPQDDSESPAHDRKTPDSKRPSGGDKTLDSVSSPGSRGTQWLRRRWRRITALIVVLVVVWWLVPLRFTAPASTQFEKEQTVTLDRTVEPFYTTNGNLALEGLFPWRHRWVVHLEWVHTDPATGDLTGVRERVSVGLGESVHVDGLGTVTLLAVNPQALLPRLGYGGWTCTLNVALDPGVSHKVRP